MNLHDYDNSCEVSIVNHAKKLVGKTIEDVLELSKLSESINIRNKGKVGLIIEEGWFLIQPNSSQKPDFSSVGIELKVIPLIQQRNKLVVKERTKICSINYQKLIKEVWEDSHAKEKLNKILFVYYLYDANDIKKSKVKKIALWKLNQSSDEMIIKNDWLNVHKKVLDGLAHQLSERDSKILAASRSGQGGKYKDGTLRDLVFQPNTKYCEKALKRAFSLKQSFTNQYWQEISTKVHYESIIQTLKIKKFEDFEKAILNSLDSFKGKSIMMLSEEFDIKVGRGKNRVATIIKKVIGFKSVQSKIKEFDQLGISVKIINVRKKNNYPCEAISLPAMKLCEFINEEWIDSILHQDLSRILFIPIFKEKCNEKDLNAHILGKCFFWSANKREEMIIKSEWTKYQEEIKSGKCQVTRVPWKNRRGYKEVTSLSKESDTNIIHIRPHGKDFTDRDIDSFGNSVIKQSFWLNKKFIQSLLNQHQ